MALYKGNEKLYLKSYVNAEINELDVYSGPTTLSPGSVIPSGKYIATNLSVAGDSDLVPANISTQVSLFGVSGDFSTTYPNSQRLMQSNITDGNWINAGYGNGRWVICSYEGTDRGLLYSSDGKMWHETEVTDGDFKDVLYWKGIWIAGGMSHQGILYSYDAIHWNSTNITSSVICSLGKGANILVAGTYNNGLYYSTDGIAWTQTNITNSIWNDILYYQGVWVGATCESNKGLYYSTDGITWTQSNITSGDFYTVSADNGVWIVGSLSNGGLYYSTDGKTWVSSNVNSDYFVNAYYADGTWVATGGNDNGLWYSADNGRTWTQSDVTDGSYSSVYQMASVWCAASDEGNGLVYSKDGVTWETSNVHEGCFFTVTNNGVIWVCSDYFNNQGIWYSFTWEYDKWQHVTWAGGTDEEIAEMVAAADRGEISLTDYWNVGEERYVWLDAMSAEGVGESHNAELVTMVLMNAGGKELVDATTSGRTECSFIVGLKNCLATAGYINSLATIDGGWESCARRTWCNSVFRNAIPSTLRGIFKQHKNVTANGSGSTSAISTDYFALPSEKEIFGSVRYADSSAEAGLSQFKWYETASNRVKKLGDSGSACRWWERSPRSNVSSYFCRVYSDGSAIISSASAANGLAPFGVI